MPISAASVITLFQQALDENWGYIWGTYGQLWTQEKQNQKIKYMVNTYGDNWKSTGKGDNYYYAAKDGAKWIGHKVADCSGLFRWAIETLGGKIAHGSNTIYDGYCSSKGPLTNGKRSDGQPLKPGTAVFCYNPGTKKRPHIGLYIGDGWVIEAASTSKGVVKSKVTDSKWKYWGELKMVTYDGENLGFPETPGWRPTIRRGDKGTEVIELQTMLQTLGYDLGSYGVDGDFGKATQAAVKAFQKAAGLSQDGVCGPLTWDALEKAVLAPPIMYTVTIYHVDAEHMDALLTEYPNSTAVKE